MKISDIPGTSSHDVSTESAPPFHPNVFVNALVTAEDLRVVQLKLATLETEEEYGKLFRSAERFGCRNVIDKRGKWEDMDAKIHLENEVFADMFCVGLKTCWQSMVLSGHLHVFLWITFSTSISGLHPGAGWKERLNGGTFCHRVCFSAIGDYQSNLLLLAFRHVII